MGSVDKGNRLVIKGFPGMSRVIYCNSSKGYTVIERLHQKQSLI